MDQIIHRRSLRSVFADAPLTALDPIPAVMITGITSDSRQVRKGFAFLAIKGESSDGYAYIPSAAANGARVILGNRPKPEDLALPYVQIHDDARYALAYLSASFQRFPARKLRMIGVTGTDGKTTTSMLIHHLLTRSGIPTGMISTVNALIGSQTLDTGFHVTTPESPDIQAYLAQMVAAGMTHCVLETTSHGLAQGRVIACDYDLAVVTNVTHEHLDYHGSYENYLQTKGKLFEMLRDTPRKQTGNLRLAILNKDDRSYDYLKHVSPPGFLTYSRINEAHFWADDITSTTTDLTFTLHTESKKLHVHYPIAGIYNVSNTLAALAAVTSLGVPLEQAVANLASFEGIPGRMQPIDLGQNFTAIVDFAHTPNALENALITARAMTHGRVIAVYGSAGLRDREKRRMMPAVSVKFADVTILTAEDPRTEPLDDILEEMAQSAAQAGGVEGVSFFRVPDRGDALRKAISLANPGDLVISCGKGHEQSMCFGSVEYDWDDRTAMQAALAEHLGKQGTQMPWLPTSSAPKPG